MVLLCLMIIEKDDVVMLTTSPRQIPDEGREEEVGRRRVDLRKNPKNPVSNAAHKQRSAEVLKFNKELTWARIVRVIGNFWTGESLLDVQKPF